MKKRFTLKNLILIFWIFLSLFTIWTAVFNGIFNNTTIMLFVFVILLFVYYRFFDVLYKIKWLNISILVLVVATITAGVFLYLYGSNKTATFREDVVIVLGAGITDGELRRTPQMRLNAALNYHTQNPDAIIIVSGGVGHRETVSEAYVMANYLMAHGVPREQILIEDRSHTTYQNLMYTRKLVDAHFDHNPSVVVITSDFHIYRSVRFARYFGFEPTVYSAKILWRNIPLSYIREIAAIIKMFVLGT